MGHFGCSDCIVSEHQSCVLPRDSRFPCPSNLFSGEVSAEHGAVAYYSGSGNCVLSGCGEGYHTNAYNTACDPDQVVEEDDGGRVIIREGVGYNDASVTINAQYRNRFEPGMKVLVMPDDGIPAYDEIEVSSCMIRSDSYTVKAPSKSENERTPKHVI